MTTFQNFNNGIKHTHPMTDDQLNKVSISQLQLVLSFFPRADTKVSILLGFDIGLLAVLATNAPPIRSLVCSDSFALLPVVLIIMSLWQLYKASVPNTRGGRDSLIYFNEIARRTEASFITQFKAQHEAAYIDDMLGQVWRNSEILKEKFDRVKQAFIFLAWAVLPWAISLAMFAARNMEAKSLLGR